MNYNNEELNTTEDIANAFADFFGSVYTINPDAEHNASMITGDEYINCGSFSVTEADVTIAIERLKNKFSKSPDNIPSNFIKSCESLIKPLTLLFNKSFSSGEYPSILKNTFVTPIFKKGSKNNICNYRGVAEMSPIAKIFDMLFNDNVIRLAHPHLSVHQHGFIKNRSTVTNLVEFTSEVMEAMHLKLQSDGIYFDYRSAFDSVQQLILIKKMENFGFHGSAIRWISSYLSNRTQNVKIGNQISANKISVVSGVGQGTHSGPNMFLITINDLPESIQYAFKELFADDFKISRRIKTPLDCVLLQNDIDNISRWASLNCLEFNVDKCCKITFHRTKNPILFDYKLNGISLNRVRQIKDLGVWLDEQLTFRTHLDQQQTNE